MPDRFSNAALLLVGHGSTVNNLSSFPIYTHAAELRRRRLFAEVREGFWKQEPGIRTTLENLRAPRVFVVPVLASEGYFSEQIIPRELGLTQMGPSEFSRTGQRGEQTLRYCLPVGTHPAMTELVRGRAAQVIRENPFPRAPKTSETALILAGHGTDRHENSRRAIEVRAEAVRQLGEYAEVHSVFIEESPRISDCYALAKARHLVVVPFFISDGQHSAEDIPRLLGAPENSVRERLRCGQSPWRNPSECRGKLVWYAASVGTDPRLAEVILERVEESATAI